MATGATIYRADLSIADMDRNYYADHSLTVARHPSETEERLMVRLLAFAVFAAEGLEFGRGLSTDDEPDLWLRDLTGLVELWIEVGQPDESRLRKACGRAREVRVYCFSGRSAAIWWQKNAEALGRLSNLQVFEVPAEASERLAALAARNMQLQCLVQEGAVQVMDAQASVDFELVKLHPAGS